MKCVGLWALGIGLVVTVGAAVAADKWPTYAGGPQRLFFNPAETRITAANVDQLQVKWSFPTGAIVTASPSVARLAIPSEGEIAVVFIQSWDGNLYALRARDGTEVWRFVTTPQPGSAFPNASSADIRTIDGVPRVYFAAGETVYCVDAVTGAELWRFTAGTGCPPGVCGFAGERNEVESSPIIARGKVFFGLTHDRVGGKGGFYAVDARGGQLTWFFDLESGQTCRPWPADAIRRFDGYHSEAELGLPEGFFASRPGCDFDRTGTGCGKVWSSAAVDPVRRLLFFASGECQTDAEPPSPSSPMPPYDEAIIALHLDGTPAWRWRPREVDPGDFDFGAVPNLFTITVADPANPGASVTRDVVGVGNKDGTYYVLDREGVNAVTGMRWNDADPSPLPYWATQVVPGGLFGGILATAAVDEGAGRIYFSTAPGTDPFAPQQPTVHALDKNTGTVLWQNTAEAPADASFAPTSAIPGVVFIGSVLSGTLRAYDAATGAKLASIVLPGGFAVASAPTVVDGLLIVGAGVGTRSAAPEDPANLASYMPQPVTAFCVPGTVACEGTPLQ